MDREIRNLLERTTQQARRLLEAEYRRQLEGTFDILPDGTIHAEPGGHLSDEERFFRARLVTAIEHRRALGESDEDSVANFRRECAFTFLDRIVALRMLEARGIIKPSVSNGEESSGFANEFLLLAPGLKALPDKGYRIYLESVFDEIGREVGVLFDRTDLAGQLWPDRPKLLELLELLNNRDLDAVWAADETIGWIYQYFNSDDERRQMRADSSAPRNSREMAVRNQFFTPRYVVEFLTDNTLGRTWYEMRQGETVLTERCRYLVRRPNEQFLQHGEEAPQASRTGDRTQEELIRETVFVPYRAPKDPREIRVLDPACGSGHFLLYCFDLLEIIYEEAWEAAIGDLRADFPQKEKLKHWLPELILRHNLHGIDIDPRAAQIGSLALWMRAQRSWNEVPRATRPTIRKTNIVVAEPMPGEADLLDEFCGSLEPKLLGQLFREVFERMKIAGDAGSLLRIETDIAEIVEEARRQWLAEEAPTDRRGDPLLFASAKQRTIFEVERVSADFWTYAERHVFNELRRFALEAANGVGFRRRLFADDAERGFAFIDICRKQFDVMLMNPPFGDASLPSKDYIDQSYGDTKGDVYKAFVEGAYERLLPSGLVGVISSRAGFFLTQSQDWRERVVLRLFRPQVLADLGEGVLDAMVETAGYVLRRINQQEELGLVRQLIPALMTALESGESVLSVPGYSRRRGGLKRHQALQELKALVGAGFMREIPAKVRKFEILDLSNAVMDETPSAKHAEFTCIRLLGLVDKQGRLEEAARSLAAEISPPPNTFLVSPASFSIVPGAPFAYWIDDSIRGLFGTFPRFEGGGRTAKQGLATADDFRFVRAWWEVPSHALLTGLPGDSASEFRNRTKIDKNWAPFAKGGRFSPFYADIYLVVNWKQEAAELKAWVTQLEGGAHWSKRVYSTEYFFSPATTWPHRSQKGFSLRPLPKGCVFGCKGPAAILPSSESLPGLLGVANSRVFRQLLSAQTAFGSYDVGLLQRTPVPELNDPAVADLASNIAEAKRNMEITDELSHSFQLPAVLADSDGTLRGRILNADRHSQETAQQLVRWQQELDESVASLYGIKKTESILDAQRSEKSDQELHDADGDDDDDDVEVRATSKIKVEELLSYAIGCIFGRWNIRFATRALMVGALPGLFDPLPVQAPGAAGACRVEVEILTDDPGHQCDVSAEMEIWFTRVFGEPGHLFMEEANEILGGAGRGLRDWLRDSFFEFHVRQYSKKPRKAPIYWQLSLPSKRYSVWLYYHRMNRDTFWRVLNDFAKPKLAQEERRLSGLRGEAGEIPTPSQRRVIQEQESFVVELATFRDDIETIAPLWDPNLNDGILLNFAPLWKLVPQLPSWQKDLREAWQKLCRNEYDWSHLAMHLWPERVVPKCASDRSLAIAHGLEDNFWQQQTNGKWQQEKVSPAEMKTLVEERSSKAVRASLEKLLAQSASTPTTRRARSAARRNS
jgi:hypothetical protein